jgi:hypothetical protein
MRESAKKEHQTEAPKPDRLDSLKNRRCACTMYEPREEKNPQGWNYITNTMRLHFRSVRVHCPSIEKMSHSRPELAIANDALLVIFAIIRISAYLYL